MGSSCVQACVHSASCSYPSGLTSTPCPILTHCLGWESSGYLPPPSLNPQHLPRPFPPGLPSPGVWKLLLFPLLGWGWASRCCWLGEEGAFPIFLIPVPCPQLCKQFCSFSSLQMSHLLPARIPKACQVCSSLFSPNKDIPLPISSLPCFLLSPPPPFRIQPQITHCI